MLIIHCKEQPTLLLSVLILLLEYCFLPLHDLQQISLGVELELSFLENIVLLLFLFLLDGHRLKWIPS